MAMTLPDLPFCLSYGPSDNRRRPATFPKAQSFREGANLRRREGVGGGFACLEAGVAGLAGRPRWRHIRRAGGRLLPRLDLLCEQGVELMKETILSLEKGAMERWRNGDPWGFVEISRR